MQHYFHCNVKHNSCLTFTSIRSFNVSTMFQFGSIALYLHDRRHSGPRVITALFLTFLLLTLWDYISKGIKMTTSES